MPCDPHKLVCIQGPTASGKSSLAEAVAHELGGEIVSADSMQIYRGMDIGTAKVPPGLRCVRYHCIDIREPGEEYSAALFQRDARAAIDDIRGRDCFPIVCGGTGLYVQAALDDMNFASGELKGESRLKYEKMLCERGKEALHRELRSVDPESARLIHPNNVRRIVRALEMHEEGESYAARKEAFSQIPEFLPSVRIALRVDRDALYDRIDRRVDEMVDAGLVDEVSGLIDRGFRDALTAAQAIGYKEIVCFLDGDLTLDEATDQIKQASRRYAKRQMSWLRRDDRNIWLDANEADADKLIDQALDLIEGNPCT